MYKGNILVCSVFVSVALTHLEDQENARQAYNQAANLDK